MSRKYKFQNQDKPYFVTFSVYNWIDVFTRNIYKDILIDSLNFSIKNKGLTVYGWCIMTNHAHIIMQLEDKPLFNIVRDIKGFTSKEIIKAIEENDNESRKKWMMWLFRSGGKRNPNNKEVQFWQQHSHPIELYNEKIFMQKLKYIHHNPVKAGFVERPEDFLYSSAKDYAGEKGLVNICTNI